MESETGFYFSTNKVKKQLGIREGRGKRGLTRGRSKKESSTQSRKGVKGKISPCRVKGQRPLWGLGQRPNCFAGDHSKGTVNQGAGSEASLPVTSRVRRRAPKPLYQPSAHCRAKWARPSCWSFRHSGSFPKRRDFAPAGARRGLCAPPSTPSQCTLLLLDFYWSRENRRCCGDKGAFRSPPPPLRSAHSCFLTFIGAGRIAAAAATRGLCARPLDPFGCTLPCLSFLIAGHSIFPQMVIY